MAFRLTRVVRTLTSEMYLIWRGEDRIGQIDVHYAGEHIYATVVLEEDLETEEESQIIAMLDEDVVTSYLSRYTREDLVIHVFRGQNIGQYSDSPSDVDEIYEDFDTLVEDYDDDDVDDDDDIDEEDEDLDEDLDGYESDDEDDEENPFLR